MSPTQTFKILMPVEVADPTKAVDHLTRVVGVVGHLVGPEEEEEAVTSPLDRTTPEHKVREARDTTGVLAEGVVPVTAGHKNGLILNSREETCTLQPSGGVTVGRCLGQTNMKPRHCLLM